MKNEIVNVSPDIAAQYLKTNINNRRISNKRVSQYAEDMKNGNWQLNGESIKFNKSGMLIDGQHRLNAIVQSKTTVQMLVTWGIDDNITALDRGQNRTTAQCLAFGGLDSTLANNSLVGMVKQHFYMTRHKNHNISDAVILSFITEYEDTLRKVMEICPSKTCSKQQRVNLRNSTFMLAIFYALEDGVPFETCQKFALIVRDGFMTNPWDSAAVVCRNDILSEGSFIRNQSEKKFIVFRIEKALSDFAEKKERRRSYSGWTEPIFSKKYINEQRRNK